MRPCVAIGDSEAGAQTGVVSALLRGYQACAFRDLALSAMH
jgi:hypothetical protein